MTYIQIKRKHNTINNKLNIDEQKIQKIFKDPCIKKFNKHVLDTLVAMLLLISNRLQCLEIIIFL